MKYLLAKLFSKDIHFDDINIKVNTKKNEGALKTYSNYSGNPETLKIEKLTGSLLIELNTDRIMPNSITPDPRQTI